MENFDVIEPVNVVIDCDEVLFEISPKWAKKLIPLKNELSNYLDIETLEKEYLKGEEHFRDFVLCRREFHLNKWLAKKDIKEASINEMLAFLSVYDENFYDDLKITNMGRQIATTSMTNLINRIYIITRTSNVNIESKRRAISKYFTNPKTEIIYVGENEKKSDYINKIDMTKGIILEDEMENIIDILDNCKTLDQTTFYIPEYGYNDPGLEKYKDVIQKAEMKNCMLLGYDAE